jgi:1-acyl-sn-glycerol-3-phosphate acyltransferase
VATLRIPATDLEDELVTPIGAADVSELRVFLNRLIYRGMLFSMGSIAVGLYQLDRKLAWEFAKLSARNLAFATGVDVKLRGLENLPDEPCIITPNHASHFDIAALLGYLPGHNRFAAKKELFSEPVLGLVMRTLGMIPIDRDNPSAAVERLHRTGSAADFSIVIFPEGTRSRDGRLQAFKKGAFALAIELGRPVVPVAIHGSSGVMPSGGYLSIRPGTVVVEVLPPIETRGMTLDDRDALRDRAFAQVEARVAAAEQG